MSSRRPWVWLCRSGALAALSACASSAPRAPVTPRPATVSVPVASAPAGPAAPLPPSPARQFQDNLVRAEDAAKAQGWVVTREIDVPDHHAAVIVYEHAPSDAPPFMSQRFDAVGAGAEAPPVSGESGMIDAARTDKDALLWNLRGDGARFVVLELTPCGANCQEPEPRVLELDAQDRFSVASAAPHCPTCMSDPDGDGIPDFTVPLATIDLGPCPRVACGPEYALRIPVDGYESWNGAAFVTNLALFKPLYAKKLAAARERAPSLPRDPKACPDDALRTAGELYAYAVIGGAKPADAIKDADRVMSGRSTAPCGARFDMFNPPKPWSELRMQLLAAKFPALDAERSPHAPAR